jgi:hypothetical protein
LAFETGAILRPRRVESAAQLLRTFLVYAHTDSFRIAAALAKSSGLLDITSEGLYYRLKHSEEFLEEVLLYLVSQCSAPSGFRILLVDATALCGPAAKGTDWRVHVGYDPLRGVPCSIQTTDSHVGEHLSLHPLEPGHLVIADRAYGTPRNMHSAFRSGADVLIRVQKGQMRILDDSGARVNLADLEERVPTTGAVSFEFDLPIPPEGAGSGNGWHEKNAIASYRLRFIAIRTSRNEVLWLTTNLSNERLSDEKACELYRVRWQVEMYFKRLKSIGDLDILNSREGPTARASILAKLILLVLTDMLTEEEQAFSPYGYRLRQTRSQPLERVRMHSQTLHLRPAADMPILA